MYALTRMNNYIFDFNKKLNKTWTEKEKKIQPQIKSVNVWIFAFIFIFVLHIFSFCHLHEFGRWIECVHLLFLSFTLCVRVYVLCVRARLYFVRHCFLDLYKYFCFIQYVHMAFRVSTLCSFISFSILHSSINESSVSEKTTHLQMCKINCHLRTRRHAV